jgi:hypothetical protein
MRFAVAAARRVVVLVNRVRRRPAHHGLNAIDRFAADLRGVRPARRDWFAGLGWAGLNWLAELGCLVASCAAVGFTQLSVGLVLTAYLAGMGASSFSPLPAGLGVADVAMVAILHRSGDSGAGAAVLCYRLISVALVVAIGWLLCGAGAARKRLGISRIRAGARVPSVCTTAIHHPTSKGERHEDHRLHAGSSRSPAHGRPAPRGQRRAPAPSRPPGPAGDRMRDRTALAR